MSWTSNVTIFCVSCEFEGSGRSWQLLLADLATTPRCSKRYNFYSYCILESTGARGWCPSWFISKVRPNTDGSQEASAKEESRSAAKGDEDKVS
jgi:hypothetical protein